MGRRAPSAPAGEARRAVLPPLRRQRSRRRAVCLVDVPDSRKAGPSRLGALPVPRPVPRLPERVGGGTAGRDAGWLSVRVGVRSRGSTARGRVDPCRGSRAPRPRRDPLLHGPVEDLGQSELGLENRDLIADALVPVGGREGVGQAGQPFAQQRSTRYAVSPSAGRFARLSCRSQVQLPPELYCPIRTNPAF